MRFDRKFLDTKVARHILLLFFLCAMLPVGGLSIVSYLHVTRQLTKQSRERLRQTGKNFEMSLLERLLFLEDELNDIAALHVRAHHSAGSPEPTGEKERPLFRSWQVVPVDSANEPSGEKGRVPRVLSATEKEHLAAGRSLLVVADGPEQPGIFLARALEPNRISQGILWARIEPDYLWAGAAAISASIKLCVMSNTGAYLNCPLPSYRAFLAKNQGLLAPAVSEAFEWSDRDQDYLAYRRSVYLTAHFQAPAWTVVLSESQSRVLAPVASFRRTFPLVILLCLLIVLYFSRLLISRSLDPVLKLKEGTRRIARREFDCPVEISSGDEFEELGNSFNEMAEQLSRQFQTLVTINTIDRGILGALDVETIVRTVLHGAGDIVPAATVSMTLLDPTDHHTGETHFVDGDGAIGSKHIRLAPKDAQKLREADSGLLIDRDDKPAPPYVPVDANGNGARSCLALPISVRQELSAVILFSREDGARYSEDELVSVRQLADQMAVALSNARLVDELAQLNIGTVRALAGAIDAKSAWTAGHSERVAQLVVAIGRTLTLGPEELTSLERGALLHDIGKIGVPAAILDKPSRLTEEEMKIMKSHVELGASIVEPIPQYVKLVPMIMQHHERLDGSGYPSGLVEEEISFRARILAVADTYDAVTFDRPYRKGLTKEQALEILRTPTEFDPGVVEALTRTLQKVEDATGPQLSAVSSRQQPNKRVRALAECK